MKRISFKPKDAALIESAARTAGISPSRLARLAAHALAESVTSEGSLRLPVRVAVEPVEPMPTNVVSLN